VTMVQHKHNDLYKTFYSLLVFLLTLLVTSEACERAHFNLFIFFHENNGYDGRSPVVTLSA